jgi:hypothetical protein
MKPLKLLLKLTVLGFSLATLHAMQTTTPKTNFLCRPNAELCSTEPSAGHCGFRF